MMLSSVRRQPSASRDIAIGLASGQDSRSGLVFAIVLAFLLLLYAIPARWIVGPFGAIGPPATLSTFGIAFLWVAGRLTEDSSGPLRLHPMNVVGVLFLWYAILTVVFANLRQLSELETTSSVRSTMTWIGLLSVSFLITDGLTSRSVVKKVLRTVLVFGGVFSFIGVLQFFGFDPVLHLRFPGLSLNQELVGTGTRSIFSRAYGTGLHAIEFGVLTASLLPIGIHFSMYPASDRQRRLSIAATLLLALSVPLSVSRSGIVSLVVAIGLLSKRWNWRIRGRAALIGLAGLSAIYMSVPGLLGTFKKMFTNFGSDTSVEARTKDLPTVVRLINERPWTGRGLGTYTIEEFTLLDNQFYQMAIEIGVIGLFLFALMLSTWFVVGIGLRRTAVTDEDAHLLSAITASIAGIVVSVLTFDLLYYRILTGTLFVLVGCLGAWWRISMDSGGRLPRNRARTTWENPVGLVVHR